MSRPRHRPEFHALMAWKQPVRVATTANVTIATALNAGDTIDGVTLVAGDRVLVKDQSTASQNGIYVAGTSPARAHDMNLGAEVPGAIVYVIAGTANGGTLWRVTNTSIPTIGSTSITWEEIDTAGDHAHEPPTSGVHKILVKRTSNFTSTNSNDSVPDYDTVTEDTMSSSWWASGDPDGFVVTSAYNGLNAIITAKAAWSDPGTSAYVEGKMYYFPAASGRNRPISETTDEDYLIAVTQAPATDNVNHFVECISDPITVGTGDRIFMTWRTSTSQTAITYNGRVAITLGAYILESSIITIEDHDHSANTTEGGNTLSPATFNFPATNSPAQTANGQAVWDSDDDVLTVGTGAARRTIGYVGSTTPLIESGSGSAGSSNETSRADHVHPAGATFGNAVGPILISDDHSTPIVFADILLTEEQDDILYADP